ncbi:hypothetical protein C8R44DRAFT_856991 [Mycena epipterygia]|nr:hypothetical protein C8R44DRAFT_856991 [Mycena epipterygia]
MSPVLQRDDAAMPPASYAYPAASSSASPYSEIVSSPSPPSPRVTFDASTIVVLLSFLVFTLWVVAIFLFAPSWRQKFVEYRARRKQAKKTKQQIQGLGFGYDGLSQAEFEELRQREEEDGKRLFMRLPQYPPSLCAIAPLAPITISTRPEGSDTAEVRAATIQVHDESESVSDPAPVYEQGDYHWQGSKFGEGKC